MDSLRTVGTWLAVTAISFALAVGVGLGLLGILVVASDVFGFQLNSVVELFPEATERLSDALQED